MIRLDALAGQDVPRQDQVHERHGERQRLLRRIPGKKFDVMFSIDMKQLLTAAGRQAGPDRQNHGDGRGEPQEADRADVDLDVRGRNGRAWAAAADGDGGRLAAACRAARRPADACRAAAGGMAGAQGRRGGEGGQRRMAVAGRRQPGGCWRRRQHDARSSRRRCAEIMQKALAARTCRTCRQEERQAAFAKMREEAKKAGIDDAAARAAHGEGGEASGRAKAGSRPAAGPGPAGRRRRPQPVVSPRAAGGGRGGGGMAACPALGGHGQFTAEGPGQRQAASSSGRGRQHRSAAAARACWPTSRSSSRRFPTPSTSPTRRSSRRTASRGLREGAATSFEARPIKIAKRSETRVRDHRRLKPGELIAMSDPTAKPGDKKKAEQEEGGGGAAGRDAPAAAQGRPARAMTAILQAYHP